MSNTRLLEAHFLETHILSVGLYVGLSNEMCYCLIFEWIVCFLCSRAQIGPFVMLRITWSILMAFLFAILSKSKNKCVKS